MFLLDTNVISELRHGKPMQNAQVLAWAEGQIFDRFFLSSITILELEKGVQAGTQATTRRSSIEALVGRRDRCF